MAQSQYITSTNMDIFDVTVIIYGTLDYLSKVMLDNDLTIDDYLPAGTVILYDSNFTPSTNRITTGTPNAYYPSGAYPVIVAQTEDISICTGGMTPFSVTPSGPDSDYTYTWYYSTDGGVTWILCPGIISTRCTGYNTRNLIINPTGFSESGFVFRCQVTNTVGSTYSTPVTLTVLGTITSVTSTSTGSYSYGGNANFTSTVATTGTFTYGWQYSTDSGVTWITAASGPIPGFSSSSFSGTNTNSFTIINYDASFDGWEIRAFGAGCNTMYSTPITLAGYVFEPETIAFASTCTSLGDPLTLANEIILDRFVKDIKGKPNGSYATNNIISLFNFIYPMMNATPAVHSINLVSPGTAPSNFYVNWSGLSAAHSSNGIQFGTGILGLTHLTPSVTASLNSKHMSFYSRTNSSNLSFPAFMGANAISLADKDSLKLVAVGSPAVTEITGLLSEDGPVGTTISPFTDTLGFIYINRSGASSTFIMKRTTITNGTSSSTNNPNGIVQLGSIDSQWSDKQGCFFSYGQALTKPQAQGLANAVQALQVSLGRGV